MATVSTSAPDSQPAPASPKRVALHWWFWAAVSAPPAALFHEFGHFVVFWSLNLPGAALHYGSAGFTGLGAFFRAVREGDLTAAGEIAPVWGVAMSLSMGLVATYVVVLACCTLCAKWKPHPLLVAMGYLSNLRIFAALFAIGVTLAGVRANPGCDECWLERITGIPLAVWALPGVVSLVWAGIFLWRYFPRQNRWIAVTAAGVGIGTGLAIWGGFLGPLLLP